MSEPPADLDVVREIDCSGLLCPLPVIETTKILDQVESGSCIAVVCTDPAAGLDMAAFCARTGHRLARTAADGEQLRFWIVKA